MPQEAPVRLTTLTVAMILSMGPLVPALGQTETAAIGKIVKLNGSVSVEHTAAVVVQASAEGSKAKVGDPVYRGDVVQTGTDGSVGITFADGSAFNLTSNARIVLNEFVYDPNGKSNSTFFSHTKGTFTLLTQKVAKT